jgi:hypothetical protein
MRATTLLLSASAGALIALGATAAPAFAGTLPPPGVEVGSLFVSTGQAVAGDIVHVSGSCPMAPAGAALPTIVSVTSTGFTGPETFSRTDPYAFDGTALVADRPGSHLVTLTCSNGTATTVFTSTVSGPTPAPAPTPDPVVPAHPVRPVTPAPAGHTGTHSGSSTSDTGVFTVEEQQQTDSGLPWGWIAAGGLVVAGAAAAGATAFAKRRRPVSSTQDDQPTQRMHV